jgi:hypothetical protein
MMTVTILVSPRDASFSEGRVRFYGALPLGCKAANGIVEIGPARGDPARAIAGAD